MLQPEQRSGECINMLSHEGLANVNMRKRTLYCHCCIPSFQGQAVPNIFDSIVSRNVHRSIMNFSEHFRLTPIGYYRGVFFMVIEIVLSFLHKTLAMPS